MFKRLTVLACLMMTLLATIPAHAQGYYDRGRGYYGHHYDHHRYYRRHHHYYRGPDYGPRY